MAIRDQRRSARQAELKRSAQALLAARRRGSGRVARRRREAGRGPRSARSGRTLRPPDRTTLPGEDDAPVSSRARVAKAARGDSLPAAPPRDTSPPSATRPRTRPREARRPRRRAGAAARCRIGATSSSARSSADRAGLLDRQEGPGIDVRLDLVSAPISSGRPTAKPSRQPVIEKLFDSEKNSTATSRAPGISKMLGATVAVERQIAVGVVVGEQDPVPAADRHRPLEVLQRRDRGGRIVGIVDEHQLCCARRHRLPGSRRARAGTRSPAGAERRGARRRRAATRRDTPDSPARARWRRRRD